MKIEILRSVMISGESVSAGSFIEVNRSDASLLIGMGKARLAAEVMEDAKPAAEAPKRSRKPIPPVSSEED